MCNNDTHCNNSGFGVKILLNLKAICYHYIPSIEEGIMDLEKAFSCWTLKNKEIIRIRYGFR
jgi:hypothetical protein